MKIIFVATLLINVLFGNKFLEVDAVCGYDACHPINQSRINVHIVPHSHDDVGWLSTVDQYYYNEVQYIISSVVEALLEDENRRFIQVETAFLYMWWNEQTDDVKDKVRQLIDDGRLEIVNGAWSMNDEAAVHYQSTIDQYTLGLRFIEDNLGKCARPRVSWQIDPFGHSREQASLLAQFGMDGVFFARLDYRDKEQRLLNKSMDMLWTGSENLGSESNIFASALYHHYSCPPGFCFDIMCKDEAIVTDINSIEYNWESRVNGFADFIKEQSQYYLTNNILITMGDDFHYQSADNTFRQLDLLIKGFEVFNPKIDGREVNLIYSTPSCYTKAVNDYVRENDITLNVKTDDFFPYAENTHNVLTGFYTSRPTSKRLERMANNLLQISKQITTIGGNPYGTNDYLSRGMGIMQHHDAITGTETDEVEKDYHKRLVKGMQEAVSEINTVFSSIIGNVNELNLKTCPLANVSICAESNQREFNVLVYNPLARTTSHRLQIPVTGGYTVTDPTGAWVESHISEPIINFGSYIHNVTVLPSILIFRAENLPPLGYKVYNFRRINGPERPRNLTALPSKVDKMGFSDKYVNFDLDTGVLKSITLYNITLSVSQKLMYYKSNTDSSNAYIFRPDNEEREAKGFDNLLNYVLVNDGNLVRVVKQEWNKTVTQIIRIYPDEDFIEFEWLVGPIDLSEDPGREIIAKYAVSNLTYPYDEFYTDSNGREMIARKRYYRPTYKYTNEEPQSGNYYPVTTRILLKGDELEFAVIPDRAEGGSSLNPGEIELMLHRAIGRSLNEREYDQPVVVKGTHYVTAGVSKQGDGKRTMAAIERDIAQRKLLQPWMFFTTEHIVTTEQSFLTKELPPNIHLLTLESWNAAANTVLIRFEHIMEKDDDPILSQEVTIDVSNLFKTFQITSMKEYTLAANTPLEESSRLTWPQVPTDENDSSPLNKKNRLLRDDTDLNITLAPMQIRTFVATIESNY